MAQWAIPTLIDWACGETRGPLLLRFGSSTFSWIRRAYGAGENSFCRRQRKRVRNPASDMPAPNRQTACH